MQVDEVSKLYALFFLTVLIEANAGKIHPDTDSSTWVTWPYKLTRLVLLYFMSSSRMG